MKKQSKMKSIQIFQFGIIFMIMIISLVIMGCSDKIQGGAVFVPEKEEVIKLGVISPLTGSAANYGEPEAKVLLIAEKEINEQGGINGKKLRLILEDGVCDAKTALSAAKKLIEVDEVKIILGGHCSTESLAIAPLVNEKKIIQLASTTSSNDYTYSGDYSFRNWPTSDYYVSKLGDVAFEKGARKIGIIYEQKDFPKSTAESFKNRFKERGGEIVVEQSFLANEKDFRNHLLKIKSNEEIDSIFFATESDMKSIIYYRTLKELGMNEDYMHFANVIPVSQKVFDETGGLNANVFTTDLYLDPESPKTKNLLQDYFDEYGEYPQTNYMYVANSYDGLYLIKDAIESCKGTESECIKSFLYSVDGWEGVAGKLSIDENGDAFSTVTLHYFDEEGNEVFEVLE